MLTVSNALTQATRHHQAGQLAEAERLYRDILAREPNHGQTLHQLGALTSQLGHLPEAIELFTAAIRADRTRADSHANLAELYRQLGDLTQATNHAMQAIKLYPSFAAAYIILGEIQKQQNDPVAAVMAFREAVRVEPENASLRGLLGELLFDLGRLADAEACFRRAVRIDSQSAVALSNLGSVLAAQRRYEEALPYSQQAGQLDPTLEAAFYNAGTTLHHLGRFTESEAAFRRAIELNPNSVRNRSRLATALYAEGRADDAIEVLREAAELEPRQAEVLCDLGILLAERRRFEESLESFREAYRVNPGFGRAYHFAGRALFHLQRFDEAIAEFNRSLAIAPELAEAEMDLGNCCQALGRNIEAIAHFRRAIALKPDFANAHSCLIYALHFSPDYDPPAIFAEHLEWGRRHADPLTTAAAPQANDRTIDRRLRIGYVSAHFYHHAVNFFVEPILSAHDHAVCDVYCYSDVEIADDATERIRSYADHWREIRALDDVAVAELIRHDKIDILVDLAGHISGGRTLVFARKPAPVQVTYIGYQNTTGMRAMDYRLTDEWSDPPGTTDALYTEQLVRLPHTFFCYQSNASVPLVEPPAVVNGCITFGSFNNMPKLTPQVLDTWAQIVAAVPDSRLLMLTPPSESVRQDVRRVFAARGVTEDRLELLDRCGRAEYLTHISHVDIALDPFPFNGHTTTCDTLWMGIPVVMMAGNSYVTRFGSSALATLGLTDWVARTEPDYREIAIRLASDVAALREWRKTLRGKLESSAIGDAGAFARNLEAAYRKMWATWCASDQR